MAELGRHVATIGHELHNPIGTAIALQSQLERDLDSVRQKLSDTFIEESVEIEGKLRDMRTGVEVLGVVSQRLDELSKNSTTGFEYPISDNTRCIAKRDYKRDYRFVGRATSIG